MFARLFGKPLFFSAFLILAPAFAQQQDALTARMEGLRQADIRLASVLFRLARANDELCQKHGPLTGLVLHTSAAYDDAIRPAVIRHFHFESPLAVEGVVAGSPAARAGILPDDSIVAIDGKAVAGDESRVEALAAIDALGPAEPITLTIRRAGQSQIATITPVQGCLAHAETDVSDDLNAATDGTIIQVDSALINLVGGDDQELASIVAHELAHIVLDHPARLTAAHVDRGLFKGFGRSARLFKQTENEADRLSVTLMANAGYDPQAAVRYWLTYGPKLDDQGGLGSTHLSWRKRAELIGREANHVAQETQRPIVPAWITSRNQPLR
ncbi:MAG TPA: M48 family metallopeptidase [Sphingomonas sp.]|nr:M48 family metallopeptidase [Sphingomonas sp.]